VDTKARFSVVAVYLLLPVGELGQYQEPLFKYELELTAPCPFRNIGVRTVSRLQEPW
jgi:hypothetical protein